MGLAAGCVMVDAEDGRPEDRGEAGRRAPIRFASVVRVAVAGERDAHAGRVGSGRLDAERLVGLAAALASEATRPSPTWRTPAAPGFATC
jgi:hypothetical protein